MSKRTDTALRNEVIYCVYVRNHTEEGTFRAVEADLDRIQALGVSTLWLMPIHPVDDIAKKGTFGCPYSIRDYRSVNEAYGSMDDFRSLADAVHARGMKLIIDVVYNHTSRDSRLLAEHPEYFHKDENGNPYNRVPEWNDVYDLNYDVPELWNYQIDTLKQWAEIVDGFRCDVAPMVPVDFWSKAVEEVEKVNPDAFWLAEVGGPGFMRHLERLNCPWWCESDLLTAFDMTYDYDGYDYLGKYLAGRIPLSTYTQYICNQNGMNSRNYVKLRFLENHDQPRAKHRIPDEDNLLNFSAFYYFLFGPALLYAGEEFENDFTPSLFEKEPIDRKGKNISEFFASLSKIKKLPIMANGYFDMQAIDERDTAIGTYKLKDEHLTGVFNLKKAKGYVNVPLADGEYNNEINGKKVKISKGKINLCHCPVIIRTKDQ